MTMTMEKLIELHQKMRLAVKALDEFEKLKYHHHELGDCSELEVVQEDIDNYILHKTLDHAEKAYEEAVAEMANLQ